MKNLFRIHFTAIAVIDLLLLYRFATVGNFQTPIRTFFGERPDFLLHFHPCSRTTAISLGQSTQKTVL